MILYYSGGSPIPETELKNPAIMLSYFVNVKKSKRPDSRLRRLLKIRKKRRARRGKDRT